MKQSKAVVKQAIAFKNQADNLAQINRCLAAIMDHMGIEAPPEPEPEAQVVRPLATDQTGRKPDAPAEQSNAYGADTGHEPGAPERRKPGPKPKAHGEHDK